MSVVVWDGKSLACDRQATSQGTKHETCKSKRLSDGNGVMAFTGDIARGLAMMYWYEIDMPSHDKFPRFQDTDNWCRLIVATRGSCFYFETTPFRIPVIQPFAAWGSGRDFTLGALARGATAKEAVEIACRFDVDCGMGIDNYDL